MDWIDYDRLAGTRPQEDHEGQVQRLIAGQSISAGQMEMVVEAVVTQLDLRRTDTILDLACGDGALSGRLQPYCKSSLGVDVSESLVAVAHERLASERHRFLAAEAEEYVRAEQEPGRFTKALCYGSLSHFADSSVVRVLRTLHARFPGVNRVLLGSLPDPARAEAFDAPGASSAMRQTRSSLGAWRGVNDIANLAWPGWRVTASTMPPGFFAAHYRYDALLMRQP